MKRFLNKKKIDFRIIVSFLVIIVIPILLPSNAADQTKTDYYKKLFGDDFDFRIYESSKRKASSASYFTRDKKEGHNIIVTSSITFEEDGSISEDIVNRENLIFICDGEFSTNYPIKFSCNSSKVTSDDGYLVGGFLKNGYSDKKTIYVIPEDLLVSTELRSRTKGFISAIERSDKGLDNLHTESSKGKPSSEEESFLNQAKNFTKTTAFESFKLSLIIFVIVGIFQGLLRNFVECGDKDVKVYKSKNIFSKVRGMSKFRRTVFLLFSVLLVVYIFLILYIGIRDGNGFNLGYLLYYTVDGLRASEIFSAVSSDRYVRVGVSVYEYLLLLLVFIFFAPLFINLFRVGISKISRTSLREGIVKYSLPLLTVLLLLSLSFFKISQSYSFIIFSIVLILFIFFNNERHKTFDYTYSKSTKIIFIFLFFIIFSGGMLVKYKNLISDPVYEKEELIGIADSTVLLPYSKSLGQNTLIKEYLFSGPEPLFVGNYLVYAPNALKLENKNIKDFKNEGSYYIQSTNIENLVREVELNQNLADTLISSFPTVMLKIDYPDLYSLKERVRISITFSCGKSITQKETIKATYYYIGGDGSVKNENKDVLYFPGCAEISKQQTYTAEFEPPYIESKHLFMKLSGVSNEDIEDVRIFSDEEDITKSYLVFNDREYQVLVSKNIGKSDILTNYFFDNTEDELFDITLDDNGKFDVSNPINNLILKDILKNKFLIWSVSNYLPVRLPD